MTTSAPKPPFVPVLEVPDPRAVRAWQDYQERLHGLEGSDYEEAEADAWDRLQHALADLEDVPALPR